MVEDEVFLAGAPDFGKFVKLVWDLCWYKFFGKLIGYGYRPWNALYASLLIVTIGAVLFKVGYLAKLIAPTGNDAYYEGTEEIRDTYPKFNMLIYSLETFVPIVKLKLEEYWIPDANRGPVLLRFDRFPLLTIGGLLRCYLWFHILAGWVLTTLWVAGFTGLLKS